VSFFDRIYDEYTNLKENIPKNKSGSRKLDCDVINYACNVLEKEYNYRIDCVRSSFIEPDSDETDSIYSGSKIYKGSHVQIAVRNTSIIKDTSLHDFGGGILDIK
jgi:hypothetical protein